MNNAMKLKAVIKALAQQKGISAQLCSYFCLRTSVKLYRSMRSCGWHFNLKSRTIIPMQSLDEKYILLQYPPEPFERRKNFYEM